MNNNTNDLYLHDSLSNFETYEDYLDSQITENDRLYLDDDELARQLVELGYRGNGETLSEKEFITKKKELDELKTRKIVSKKTNLCSDANKKYENPLLNELAQREKAIRSGKLTSIIYIRMKHPKNGYEISGYIDYAHRLKEDSKIFHLYFNGKRKLMPRQSDLSYYNWETQVSSSNPTENFQVIANDEAGLLLKIEEDRKIIDVNPDASRNNDTTIRYDVDISADATYLQVVIFDHNTRRKL